MAQQMSFDSIVKRLEKETVVDLILSETTLKTFKRKLSMAKHRNYIDGTLDFSSAPLTGKDLQVCEDIEDAVRLTIVLLPPKKASVTILASPETDL